MAGPIEATPSPKKSAHLMCGSKLWTIVAFASCAYFARAALMRPHGSLREWSHDPLALAAHLVWVAFMIGLITETRCWKERIFFILLGFNFLMAFTMGIWRNAPSAMADETRQLSAALWILATLASLLMIFLPGEKLRTGNSK